MSIDAIRALRAADRVSASQLVRRFGHWQTVANERPVFVLHHGSPRWALMSMPMLSDLADQADTDAGAAHLAALHDVTLDHMRTMMIVLDKALDVSAINAAARAHLSIAERDAIGQPLAALVPEERRTLLVDAATRVAASGVAETVDFESAVYPGRRMQAELVPVARGVALFIKDMSHADDLFAARTSADSFAALCAACGRVATGRLTARGLIEGEPAMLAAMTGVAAPQLGGVRLTSLVDVADRPSVNAAIDAVFETARSVSLPARLLKHGADPVPVTIALGRDDSSQGLIAARYLIVDGAPAARAQATG